MSSIVNIKCMSLNIRGLVCVSFCADVCVYSCVFFPYSHLAIYYRVRGQAFPTDPFVLNSSAVAPVCPVVCLLQLCKMCECVCVWERDRERESERARERERACMRQSGLN